MKIRWLLPLNMLLWGLSIPAMNYGVMAFSAHRIAKVPDGALPVFIFVLLIWAGLIYWRLVPAVHGGLKKALAFAGFALAMFSIALGGLWVAFVVAAATYGV